MRTVFFALVAGVLFSCDSRPKDSVPAQLAPPEETSVVLQDLCFDQFTGSKALLLKRYFSGNQRWEVCHESDKVFAIRKEKQNGNYLTSFNGVYSRFDDTLDPLQTRVVVSFGKYYGFGNDESGITFTDSKNKTLAIKPERGHEGSPGNSSYLLIKSAGINVEIFEQAKSVRRSFTQETINALNKELHDVLKHEKELSETGVIPVEEYYPAKTDSSYFQILDGMQPGIYIVRATVKPDRQGIVYTKVFNVKTNKQLSEDRITPRSTREVGWSKTGERLFQYESELTVYEGDWNHLYNARFEIWFKDASGAEKKLAEKTALINGWQR